MKILVIGDCHGQKPEIPGEDFDLVLAVGDICGGTDEMRTAMFEAIDSEKQWYEIMGEEEAKEAVNRSIEEGKDILEQLNSIGTPVFIVPGNWDWTGNSSEWEFLNGKGYPAMLSGYENIHDLNYEARMFQDYRFIGYGPCSGPEIPQYEDDKPESEEEMREMEQAYEENRSRLSDLFTEDKTVFLSHNAPQDTDLDMIDNPDSPKHGRHYGSVIVRELVDEFAPEFNIAGHMHESEGVQDLGDTRCVNTGLNNVLLIDTASGEVEFC